MNRWLPAARSVLFECSGLACGVFNPAVLLYASRRIDGFIRRNQRARKKFSRAQGLSLSTLKAKVGFWQDRGSAPGCGEGIISTARYIGRPNGGADHNRRPFLLEKEGAAVKTHKNSVSRVSLSSIFP